MKKFVKIIAFILIFFVIAIAGGLIYFNSKFPREIPVADIKVEVTPERIERGRYLAHNVSMCLDCHSERDWTKYSAPIIDGTWGKGGEVFDEYGEGREV